MLRGLIELIEWRGCRGAVEGFKVWQYAGHVSSSNLAVLIGNASGPSERERERNVMGVEHGIRRVWQAGWLAAWSDMARDGMGQDRTGQEWKGKGIRSLLHFAPPFQY